MSVTDYVLLHSALASFALAALSGVECVRRDRAEFLHGARGLVAAGLFLILVGLLRRGLTSGSFPVASLYEILFFAGALLSLFGLALDLIRGLPILTLATAPLSFMALLVAAFVGGAPGDATAAVRQPWVGFHVVIMLIAYGLFALAAIAGALYLVQQRQLKAHAQASVLGIMPPLESARRLMTACLTAGVAMMTIAILVGYQVGRRDAPAPGWRVSIEIWGTTVSWALYLTLAIFSHVPAFKGRRTAAASVVSFVVVMAIFWMAAFLSNFHHFV